MQPNVIMFDITSDEDAQNNYISSIGHYRSWQYSGSNKQYQFGLKNKWAFVTRPSCVFVFYELCVCFLFQMQTSSGGVGYWWAWQSGSVENAITNNFDDESQFVLQFQRKSLEPDYIRSSRTHNLKYNGNYTKAGKHMRRSLAFGMSVKQ